MTTESQTRSSGTVLIVDDAPGNLAVLSDMLSETGYRVLVATDGISALEQIEFLKPDIILLDIKMPGIDGFETCRRLKDNQQTVNIPIIFMTGLTQLEDLLQGFDEGAVDYIVKPIRPEEVLARVEAQLSQSRNLFRAVNALDHVAFATLTFNATGQITWLTTTAVQVFIESFSAVTTENSIHQGDLIPESMWTQIIPLLKTRPNTDETVSNEIRIGNDFIGKMMPCHNNEFMVLIHKRSQEWDLAALKRSFGLTAREAEILMWISRGKTNKEVGMILGTSPRTVNKHLEHSFTKLGVPTRTAAVAKVMKNKQTMG